MGRVELSDRLKNIADMVLPCDILYDVGCDHGFLSIYSIEKGKAGKAVAMDVVKGPLNAAAEHVKEAGFEDVIECRLSDGLHNVTTEEIRIPDCRKALVIAGMGGPLILRILSECPDIRDGFDEIIVGPQSQIEEFRRGIREQGLTIVDEDMVLEDGKYYPIIKMEVRQDTDKTSELTVEDVMLNGVCETEQVSAMDVIRINDIYGPVLIRKKHPVLKQYVEFEKNILQGILDKLDGTNHSDRRKSVGEEMRYNRLAARMIRV